MDWFLEALPKFRLLSKLCSLAQTTANDTIEGFMMQSIVTSNLLTEHEFYFQQNTTISQLTQSAQTQYRQLIDTVRLLTEVDQPMTGPKGYAFLPSFNAKLILTMNKSQINNQTIPQVNILKHYYISILFLLSVGTYSQWLA